MEKTFCRSVGLGVGGLEKWEGRFNRFNLPDKFKHWSKAYGPGFRLAGGGFLVSPGHPFTRVKGCPKHDVHL